MDRRMLDEKLISPVIEIEPEIVKNRMEILVQDILNVSILIGEGRTSERLEKARRRREKLEVGMEPHPSQRGEKRKIVPTKKDRMRDEEREAAQDIAGSILDLVMDRLCVQHDCCNSTACPGWWCMMMMDKKSL
jgi:hypothetical protein